MILTVACLPVFSKQCKQVNHSICPCSDFPGQGSAIAMYFNDIGPAGRRAGVRQACSGAREPGVVETPVRSQNSVVGTT